MCLIFKDFFAVSKKLAQPRFRAFFRAKTTLSTGLAYKATDRFPLSRPAVHFYTFCVDKIVSKAQVTNSSL
jgi:hypothetical protein